MPNDSSTPRQMVREAMRAPYLEREEEHALAFRWKDERDQEALHRLTASAHMRLVIAIAAQVPAFRPVHGRPRSRKVTSGSWRPRPASSRNGTSASRPMRRGGYGLRCRITSCATGRSCAAARHRRQKALFFNLRRLRAKLNRGAARRTSNSCSRTSRRRIGVSQQGRRPDGFAPVRPRSVAERAGVGSGRSQRRQAGLHPVRGAAPGRDRRKRDRSASAAACG